MPAGSLVRVVKGKGPRRVPRMTRYRYVRTRKGYQPKEEFKYKDSAVTTACDTTGALTLLNGLQTGDDSINREGREVRIRSIQFKGFTGVTTGTGIDQYHRVLVVFDRQTNAAAPAITDILTANGTTAPRNLDNRRRFVILYDRTYSLNAAGEAGSASRMLKYYKRFNLMETFNSGNAGTVADITTGSIYMITMGSVAAGATAGSASINVRVRFTG